MKIVYSEEFNRTDYESNRASVSGRMEAIMTSLKKESQYKIITPTPASFDDIALAHSKEYIENISEKKLLFKMASLSAGGAILASLIGYSGESAFACIRPPGHHASKYSGWGYCVFCNMGIALLGLKKKKLIKSAFILDFDAHTGDGTIDVLSEWKDAIILNPMADNNIEYLKIIEEYISNIQHVDIIAISAGFDTYIEDIGKQLTTFDFYLIGRLMRQFSKRLGHKRIFAILEGGYYLPDLGKNILSFCHGFDNLK